MLILNSTTSKNDAKNKSIYILDLLDLFSSFLFLAEAPFIDVLPIKN